MKDKKMIFRISLLVILALAVIGVTYAWFIWRAPEDKNVSVSIGQITVNYEDGPDITNNNLIPVSSKEKGIVKNINVSSSSPTTLYMNLYLNVKSISDYLKDASFKWAIYNGDSVVTEGDFVSYVNGDDITLLDGVAISSTITTYTLYIWIDGNMTNPNYMYNQNFEFYLHADASNEGEGNLATNFITNIYNGVSKSKVMNNSVEYNYATEVSMMEDIGGNIRYYGTDPNNYVTFNNELWRIIGVFKDIDDGTGKVETRLKIARSESIGNYEWDDDSNEWSTATLNTYLNGTYLTGLTSEAQNMSGDALWNLGGISEYEGLYANDYYNLERGAQVYTGRSATWTGKIALMYPSDYMYAGDFSKCSVVGANWDNDVTNCRDTSWLRNTNTTQWTLTPLSNGSLRVFRIYATGCISNDLNSVAHIFATRPTLYLKSNVKIISGDGSSSNPYQLSV